MSPTTNTSGWPGQGQVVVDGDAAGAVELRPGLLGQLGAELGGLHPGGPDLADRLDAAVRAVGVLARRCRWRRPR